MTPSWLNTLLIVHFEIAGVFVDQVNEVDGVVAIPSLATFVVSSHTSKNHCKPVFVHDGGVVAARRLARDWLLPAVTEEGVDINGAKSLTAMPSDQKGLVFKDDESMAFP